ncbi:hypothetical protein ASPBRDRAFT_657402, partial [Aspergillus brasiliensis CBS 101740]
SQIPPSSRRQSLALLRKEPCGSFCHSIFNLDSPDSIGRPLSPRLLKGWLYRATRLSTTRPSDRPHPPPRFASRRKLPVDYLRPRDSASPPTRFKDQKRKPGGACQKYGCQSHYLSSANCSGSGRNLAVTERSYQQRKREEFFAASFSFSYHLRLISSRQETKTLRGTELYSTFLQFDIYAPYTFSFVVCPYDPAF